MAGLIEPARQHAIVLRAQLLSVEHAERVWRLAQRLAPGTMWLVTSGHDEGDGARELRQRAWDLIRMPARSAATTQASMNWTLSRTHAALTTVDQRLRDVGQALRIDTGHRYAITTDPHALELSARQHAREQHDTARLDLTTARILETALDGRRRERAWSEFTTPEQRTTLQRLLDLDLITEDGFLITATPELRVDLGYDGAPPGHMRGW